ncbi:MAG TPA: ATP-dependent RecD-like DNA helicase [Firmicutes bacterium]|nr:ATP-dependent RecD-like DNA helicase [Bacillota bacterium]
MNYIKGKIKHLIFESTSGYKVGLIRVKETNDPEMEDFINKSVTFTGYFADLTMDDVYVLEGSLVYTEKYGYQYKVENYHYQEVEGKDAVIEFLASPLVKGCGEKTACDIVETLGEDALKKIKESYTNLLLVPKMTEKKALKIYDSIMKYRQTDEMIVELKNLGFTINEALSIINKYGDETISIVKSNPYCLNELIDFNKLDKVYLNIGTFDDETRIKACLVETIKRLEMADGDTYFSLEEILDGLKRFFSLLPDTSVTEKVVEELSVNNDIIVDKDKYYLKTTYEMEYDIAKNLSLINNIPPVEIKEFDTEIIKLQKSIDVTYNKEQLLAIKKALENRISIITGGPGTGKTTIIKAITKLYIKIHNLRPDEISSQIALLAPTGRAAKKLAESTGLPASTIHRYLKWNKEANDFQINELNKNFHRLVIVDETSMIDTHLFDALLKGICTNIQLILVGDANQLPSVGPGLILSDLINSDVFTFTPLETIYRQSNNSYIPYLAQEIKNKDLSNDYLTKKDDYNFLNATGSNIRELIKMICERSIKKGLTDKDIQILAPMYKGENGIDHLNEILRDLFNPPDTKKKEIKVGEVTYRVGDKVLQLTNDPNNGVFNGDIGYIKDIVTITVPKKQETIVIDFDGNKVDYKKEDMNMVKHAYAISIHKSQGSEFPHVIMPITKSYYKMLYNKLIYTGVSRAKKSLVLIGEPYALIMAVNNDYSNQRKTTLKERLLNNI